VNLHVKVAYLKGKPFAGLEAIVTSLSYRRDDQFIDIECDSLSDKQLDELRDVAQKNITDTVARAIVQRITTYQNVKCNPAGQKIGKLEALVTALKGYIEPTPNKWLFSAKQDGYAVPYFVSDIRYHEATKNNPANVRMELKAIRRNSSDSRTITFHRYDIVGGKTVVDVLNAEELFLENLPLVADYRAAVDQYLKISGQTGSQWSADGIAYDSGGRYSGTTEMKRDDVPATVVMDDVDEEDEDDARRRKRKSDADSLASGSFWKAKGKGEGDDDKDSVALPVHPYVHVFDLRSHEFVTIHVSNLTAYVFDKSAASKLVLPEITKDLVTILVEGSAEVLEDIVRGKTGGTIVIATGPPGTGKTLTAEVFSEQIERPLYVVQCSQLGIDEETVEKRLSVVLDRASRWKAILLIDEADVYIHERGSDIRQNAIVGVFLRVLEHYRGVLFMTSNRGTIIDDAIMSRASAWIRYEYPTKEQIATIWEVLSKQYKLTLSPSVVTGLVQAFPRLSGRNVKNMLKLARVLARSRKGKAPDVEFFKYVAKFLDLKTDEEGG